jgi:hypothetical protein
MRNWSLPFLTIAVTLTLFSCKKEKNEPNNALNGTWKFTTLHAETKSINDIVDGTNHDRVETTSNYDSFDNDGTITFSGNSSNSAGITYRVVDTAIAMEYYNNILIDSLAQEFDYYLDPTSSTSTFQIVGQDSLTVTNGSSFVSSSPGTMPITGAKFSINGNTLTFYMKTYQEANSSYLGYPMHTTNIVNTSMTLIRE